MAKKAKFLNIDCSKHVSGQSCLFWLEIKNPSGILAFHIPGPFYVALKADNSDNTSQIAK